MYERCYLIFAEKKLRTKAQKCSQRRHTHDVGWTAGQSWDAKKSSLCSTVLKSHNNWTEIFAVHYSNVFREVQSGYTQAKNDGSLNNDAF